VRKRRFVELGQYLYLGFDDRDQDRYCCRAIPGTIVPVSYSLPLLRWYIHYHCACHPLANIVSFTPSSQKCASRSLISLELASITCKEAFVGVLIPVDESQRGPFRGRAVGRGDGDTAITSSSHTSENSRTTGIQRTSFTATNALIKDTFHLLQRTELCILDTFRGLMSGVHQLAVSAGLCDEVH
jgi:hypothetical protein